MQRIQLSHNQAVFGDLESFVKRVQASELALKASRTPFMEIPTALLLTGVNLPDHEAVFLSLQQHLQV